MSALVVSRGSLAKCFVGGILFGLYCGGIALAQGLGNCKKCNPASFKALCPQNCNDTQSCTGTNHQCNGNTPRPDTYNCARKHNYSCYLRKCDGKCQDDGVTPCKCTATGC